MTSLSNTQDELEKREGVEAPLNLQALWIYVTDLQLRIEKLEAKAESKAKDKAAKKLKDKAIEKALRAEIRKCQ